MKSSKAFTLIEVAMVIVIAIVLSAAGIAAINNVVKSIRLGNAVDKVVSDLRYAEYMANNQAVWYGVTFEAAPVNRYRVYTTTGTVDTTASPDPLKAGSTFEVYLNTDFGIQISSAEIGNGTKVEFRPDGVPFTDKNNSPTYPLTTEGVVTLSNGSTTKIVRITPYTGRIYAQ